MVSFKMVKSGALRDVTEYKAVDVGEAVALLREDSAGFKLHTKENFRTNDVFFAIESDAVVPKIFVMKKYKIDDKHFAIEHNAFEKVNSMDLSCKKTIVTGKSVVNGSNAWIVMEYYDGAVAEYIQDAVLTDAEKVLILKTTVDAVRCLHGKKLCYIDMKIDQILYRRTNGELEFRLGDLEVLECGRGSGMKITYKPPRTSRHVTGDGFFKVANDAAIVWGILVLIINLWSSDNGKQYISRESYANSGKVLKKLKSFNAPAKILGVVESLYDTWEDLTINEVWDALK